MAEYHDNGALTIGTLTMSNSRVNGTMGGIPIDLGFDGIMATPSSKFVADGIMAAASNLGFDGIMGSRKMVFLPNIFRYGLGKFVSGVVPVVTSHYGSVTSDPTRMRMVGNSTLKAAVPLVKTTYAIPAGLSVLRWAMISASQFEGTDLQVELVASPILTEALGYIAPVYVFFEGTEYHLNSLFDLFASVSLSRAGDYDNDQAHRVFEAEIRIKSAKILLSCSAPVEQFAFLEQEGSTYIHSTVFGDCTATVNKMLKPSKVYTSFGVNLLEIKGTSPAVVEARADVLI